MSDAKVIFILNGSHLGMQCSSKDNMRNICQKYATKIDKNFKSLSFFYEQNKINFESSFKDQANEIDRKRNEMTILVVYTEDKGRSISSKCGEKIELTTKKIDDIVLSYNEVEETLNGIIFQIKNIINSSSVNSVNIQLKNINKMLASVNEDIKKNNEKLISLKNYNDVKTNYNSYYNNKSPLENIKYQDAIKKIFSFLDEKKTRNNKI